PGIEIRGREDNLVTDPPASGVQNLYRGAACVGRVGQLGPGVLPVTVQAQGSAHDHDPAVTAIISPQSTKIFAFDVVGEGDGRRARVGFGFGANLQFPVQHDPLGGQLKVLVVCEAEFAIDRQTAQRWGTDVEDDVLARGNGDLVACAGHVSVGPGGSIRPARLLGRRRSSLLGVNDSEYADEQECWKERSKKDRAMLLTQGINPPSRKIPRTAAENHSLRRPLFTAYRRSSWRRPCSRGRGRLPPWETGTRDGSGRPCRARHGTRSARAEPGPARPSAASPRACRTCRSPDRRCTRSFPAPYTAVQREPCQ